MTDEPDYCCPGDTGGSHYHCPHCGCVCSMMGHAGMLPEETTKFCPPPEERPSYAARFVSTEPYEDVDDEDDEDLQ